MAAIPLAISGCCSSSCLSQPGLQPSTRRRHFKVTAMAPQKKVNRYDENWSKQWFGAGIFVEGSEEVPVDVFKKLEERKVLSTVEKAGLLSKAEELGVTLSSLEKLGLLSKAEDLGLLSLVENAAAVSPSVLASVSLPLLVFAIAAVVVVPDDSAVLVALQAVVAALLLAGAAGLFVGSVVLAGPGGSNKRVHPWRREAEISRRGGRGCAAGSGSRRRRSPSRKQQQSGVRSSTNDVAIGSPETPIGVLLADIAAGVGSRGLVEASRLGDLGEGGAGRGETARGEEMESRTEEVGARARDADVDLPLPGTPRPLPRPPGRACRTVGKP